MAEVYENTGEVPIATLSVGITSGTNPIPVSKAASAGLQTGTFRILIDKEIMRVTAGAGGTSWTVERPLEGTTAAAHSLGASVFHELTVGGFLQGIKDYGGNVSEFVVEAGGPSTTLGETGLVISFGSPGGNHGVFAMRRGTAAEWTAAEGTAGTELKAGELGLETDTGKLKVGKEVSGSLQKWGLLTYWGPVAVTALELTENYLGITKKGGGLKIQNNPATTGTEQTLIWNPTTTKLEWGTLPSSGITEGQANTKYVRTTPAGSAEIAFENLPTATGEIIAAANHATPYKLKFEPNKGSVEGEAKPGRFAYIVVENKPEWVTLGSQATLATTSYTIQSTSFTAEPNKYYLCEPAAATTLTVTLPEFNAEKGHRIFIEVYKPGAGGKVIIKQPGLAAGNVPTTIELTKEEEVVAFICESGAGRQWRPYSYYNPNKSAVVSPLTLTGSGAENALLLKGALSYTGTPFKYENNAGELLTRIATNGGMEISFGTSTKAVAFAIRRKASVDTTNRFEIGNNGEASWGLGGVAATDTTLERGSRAGMLKATKAIGVTGLGGSQEEGNILGVMKAGNTSSLAEPKPNGLGTTKGLVYKPGDLVFDKNSGAVWQCYAEGVMVEEEEVKGTLAKWRTYRGKNVHAEAAGLITENYDLATMATGASYEFTPVSGTFYFVKLMWPSWGLTPNNVWLNLTKKGKTLSYARVGFYQYVSATSVVKLAQTVDFKTKFETEALGIVKLSIEGGATFEGSNPEKPWIWAGILIAGTEMPTISTSPQSLEAINGVYGPSGVVSKENARVGVNGTGLIELPATFEPKTTNIANTASFFWAGIN